MSESLDPYVAWLDYASHDRAPGYYALLGLPLFETDLQRIQQALLERSTIVSNHLQGPKSAVAARVLAELSYAEQRLTDATSKAGYDALLRKSLGNSRQVSAFKSGIPTTDADDGPVMLVEVEVQPAKPSLPEPIEVPASAVPAEPERPLKAASGLDRTTTTVAADAAIQAESRSLFQRRATQGPAPAPQLAGRIRSLAWRVARHRKRMAAGLAAVLALWAAFHAVGRSSKDRPQRGPYIVLEPAEELAVGEQFGILYDSGQPADVRTASVEKLRSLSPGAIRKYAGRLKDVAQKQPEAEIQQSLQDILNSAGVSP